MLGKEGHAYGVCAHLSKSRYKKLGWTRNWERLQYGDVGHGAEGSPRHIVRVNEYLHVKSNVCAHPTQALEQLSERAFESPSESSTIMLSSHCTSSPTTVNLLSFGIRIS